MTRGNYAVRRGSLVSHNHEQVTRAVDDQTTWRNCSWGSTAFMARAKELLAAGRGGRARLGLQAAMGAAVREMFFSWGPTSRENEHAGKGKAQPATCARELTTDGTQQPGPAR
jgi:hypothetical protein